MQLSVIDQAKYPRFARFVKFDVPKLSSVPQIVKNVTAYGHLTYLEFQNAVTWGKGPNIVIKDLHHGQCGVAKAYGCFRPAKPGSIEIHTGTVNDFEKASATSRDKTKKGKSVYVVGATLLHELCHWGNFNDVPRIPELKEMGAEFEKHTYGKIIY